MAEIARRAGVVRATIYVHFPTRESLLDAVMEKAVAEVAEAASGAEPQQGEPTEALVRVLRATWQKLDRFQPWDGKDFLGLPVLIKAKGKTTTDHISAAGKWLEFRGHLDNISDNMFTGAINAFSGEAGTTKNLLTGEKLSVPKVARDYKAHGLRWVVVGDENYGEGSSREHAAMSPRFLGAAAVLVRSFARIHESNLKKQGILPLTFADKADYDEVREDDRVSIVGLADLAPGKDVGAILHHADGSEDPVTLRHTLNAEQIAWFRAGSALNVIKQQTGRVTPEDR